MKDFPSFLLSAFILCGFFTFSFLAGEYINSKINPPLPVILRDTVTITPVQRDTIYFDMCSSCVHFETCVKCQRYEQELIKKGLIDP